MPGEFVAADVRRLKSNLKDQSLVTSTLRSTATEDGSAATGNLQSRDVAAPGEPEGEAQGLSVRHLWKLLSKKQFIRFHIQVESPPLMTTSIQLRRIFCVAVLLCGAGHYSLEAAPAAGVERFYIGTSTSSGGSLGIYQSSLNLVTGTFGATNLAATMTSPTFIALTPDHRFLYAADHDANWVAAYSVNPTNGNLTFLNQQSSQGSGACHVAVDGTGRNVVVANYTSGSVTAYPIQTNGQLGAATAHIQDPGASPHAHCTTFDASNHFAFVCDLGLDQVRAYVFDPVAGTLDTNTLVITPFTTGAGPRHMTFDWQYQRAYVICEVNSTIVAFNYNPTNGVLTPFQTNSTLPAGYTGANTAAEIAVHPTGKFLYGSNRTHNSIVVFAINPTNGSLTLVQHQATGNIPRHFAIDPTGAFCIVANQNSNSILLYSINPQTGQLTATGQSLTVSKPYCVVPYIVQLPQPALTGYPTADSNLQLNISNSLDLLTYQLYQATVLSTNTTWNLLTTGDRGQTNFVLTNLLDEAFLRAKVLTSY
jgi:6-phosphogluconolactonase